MASASVPNGVVPALVSAAWLTADTSLAQRSGRKAVTADNDTTIPNPQVEVNDPVIDNDPFTVGAGGVGESWEPTSGFPWPALAENGSGVVAVTPGMTGNGNDNDDPSGLPGYDGPQMLYRGAYNQTTTATGHDALAQTTDTHGWNQYNVANGGYQQNRVAIGNKAPGYVNWWRKIWTVTPPVKTANQFTAQPVGGNSLPAYADLSLSNSGGPAYYVNGPQAPQVSQAAPPASYTVEDPTAGWS